ncbi:MAG: hypothetical protein HYT46_03180 [Candidatus Vogelbacteria bacterium]|nr:hypothetical protein [Candidatus Vogelbacteria bacterium]
MLTNQDIAKLTSVLVTKQEFQLLDAKVDSMRETLNSLLTAIDGLTKVIDNLRVEYAAVTSQLNRHERWIQQIAQKAKIKLEAAI